ncbi:hypothetical protein IE81DRAFT_362469 [Ceraceosorus guamensis]|uniref:Uncharacterized protein n=1 Tax=Ceraceosorus guamensis TaxID=1522189 RepID=A0A316VX16_9BASI|nr:hypothetical protein IE81DRAFT_362469 [Ceraceosorus guamensis]PWN40005.1 hypothetical protein IE81DRAFT_362469 [Ceraceosorus guamensis]
MTSVGAVSDLSICDISVASADPNTDQLTLHNVQQELAKNLAAMMQGIQAVANSHKEDHANLKQRVVNLNKTVKKQTRANNDLKRKFVGLQEKMTDAVSSTVAEALRLHCLDVSNLETRVSSLAATTAPTIAAATTTTAEEVNLPRDRLTTAEQTAAEVPALRERIAELEAGQAATEAQRATESAILHAVVARLDALSGEHAALVERVVELEQQQSSDHSVIESDHSEIASLQVQVEDLTVKTEEASTIGAMVTGVEDDCAQLEARTKDLEANCLRRVQKRSWMWAAVCGVVVFASLATLAYVDAQEPTFSSWLQAFDEMPEHLIRLWKGAPLPPPSAIDLIKAAVLRLFGAEPAPLLPTTFSALGQALLARSTRFFSSWQIGLRFHIGNNEQIALAGNTIKTHWMDLIATVCPFTAFHIGNNEQIALAGNTIKTHWMSLIAIVRPFTALLNAHWMSFGLWLHRHV